jgi:hypothetical protein
VTLWKDTLSITTMSRRLSVGTRHCDQHRRHDASLTEASDERPRFPLPHRDIPDQALPARAPTVESHHIGCGCSFVDKHKVRGVKQPLLAHPASARTSHVGSLAFCRLQTFF